ncbi:MAG: hypothetical protein ABIP02_07070, partial [Arenimonas sp.]
ALSLEENLPFAQFIKLRAEIRKDPKQALARLENLEKVATSPEAKRMVLAWRGLAFDKLQQFGKAADSFDQMNQLSLIQNPLPAIFPSRENSEPGIQGTLLWAPTGVRVEIVLQTLAQALGSRLLGERNLPSARTDRFGHLRGIPGSPEAGTAESWQEAIRQLGLDPETVVDWIPHFDGETVSALKGLRTVAVICDPRNALINWLVYGSAQAYRFDPNINISAEWLAQTCEAFAEHLEKNPDLVSVVKIDGLPEQAASVALALQTALNLDETLDEKILGLRLQARGGFDNQFPSGHWRHYRDSFKVAFDRLTPVAVRLGYPEN